MTPKTRQRKSRLAEDHSNFVQNWNLLNEKDIVDVVLLSLQNLGLGDELDKALDRINTNDKSIGRKMTKFETRKLIWDFFHSNATPSTITSRPAKLKVSERPKIQSGFDTTNIVTQRRMQFYEYSWMMVHTTHAELYQKYIISHPDHIISPGTFIALRPFYVRTETEKDIEMCCCMMHLHARWFIAALIECAEKLQIDISFSDYNTFFTILYQKCEPCPTAYIKWSCTPNKKTFCDEISEIWDKISQALLVAYNKNVVVNFLCFEIVEHVNKKGETVSRLKPVMKSANMAGIIEFINDILPKIINHRNHLKHYRNTINIFRDSFRGPRP